MNFPPLNRSSSKWRRYPGDVLPMHVAEMDFEVAEPIRSLIIEMTRRSDLGYLGPIPEVAESFSGFAKSRWNWQISKSELKLATDVGVAAVEILRVLTKPGDSVLINSPVYSSFRGWIGEVGCQVHDVPLLRNGNSWRLDLSGIESAFANGVKVFLLCSPQNPVGTIHSADELRKIAQLADKYGAVVISDEIHAPLSWGNFIPYLSLGPEAENTGVTITSSSKAWNTAGLKAAFLITQGNQVAEKLKALPEAMHWRSSLLGGFAMAASFADSVQWLDESVEQIRKNYFLLGDLLQENLPQAQLSEMESTYLGWIDLQAYELQDPATTLLREGRVSLVPGADHGGEDRYKKFVRFNFATSEDRITEAVKRMASVINR